MFERRDPEESQRLSGCIIKYEVLPSVNTVVQHAVSVFFLRAGQAMSDQPRERNKPLR